MSELKKKDLLIINDSLLYLSSLKTKAWYGVSRNLQKLKSPLEEISENRKAIQEKLQKKDKDGNIVTEEINGVQVPLFEDKEQADKLWSEFMDEEAPKIDFYKIEIEKLEDIELDALVIEPLLDKVLVEKV
jgi:hypothetical protein